MPFSPEEIERKHFLMALRGYDKDQVDAFLKELAAEQQALLSSVDAARKERAARGSPSGPDRLEGLVAQLESILKHAAEQADQLRSAAADDVARQLDAAHREVARAGAIRAAAEQEAAQARRELEKARNLRARGESHPATTMERPHRELNAKIGAATQHVDELHETTVEQRPRAAMEREAAEREATEVREAAERKATEVREAAEREAAEVRGAAEREATELREMAEREATEVREMAEREAAEVRALAEREAAEVRALAEREAAEVREAAEREAAELRGAAEWACQESANMLEAAEEELRQALCLRAERSQDLGMAPVVQRSNGIGPRPDPDADRNDSSQPTTTRSWLPLSED